MQKSPDSPHAPALHWDDVRYFLTLARRGSLSGAARELRVEHSTVARRVDALEESLNVRLFDRLPRGWSLTAEGETLLDQAARMENEALAFSRAALGAASLQGTVRLSAPPALAGYFLTPRLGALRRQWPGVDLEIIGESRDANLARGEADLALRLSRPEAPGLNILKLAEMGYGLYATPEWKNRAPMEWEFLGYDGGLRHVPQQQWLEKIAAGRRFPLRSNDLGGLLNAAAAGLGVAALPHFLARGENQKNADALVELQSPTPAPSRTIWLTAHPDVRRSPRVRVVADALTALMAASRDLFVNRDAFVIANSADNARPAADY